MSRLLGGTIAITLTHAVRNVPLNYTTKDGDTSEL